MGLAFDFNDVRNTHPRTHDERNAFYQLCRLFSSLYLSCTKAGDQLWLPLMHKRLRLILRFPGFAEPLLRP